MPADTVATAVLAANTGQAFDWPSGANVMRLSGATTAGAAYSFAVNFHSTSATWPSTSMAATTATTSINHVIHGNDSQFYQLGSTATSTGFSLVSPTSGIVTVEFWKR
jgi:hypothetical protein